MRRPRSYAAQARADRDPFHSSRGSRPRTAHFAFHSRQSPASDLKTHALPSAVAVAVAASLSADGVTAVGNTGGTAPRGRFRSDEPSAVGVCAPRSIAMGETGRFGVADAAGDAASGGDTPMTNESIDE